MNSHIIGEDQQLNRGCQIRQDWEGLFPPAVLSRGYRYFENDAVLFLKPAGECWIAEVEGSRAYDVVIAANVLESECACPYFEEEGLCKHIAAACYEIVYQHGLGAPGFGPGGALQAGRLSESPSSLMSRMGDEAVRAYLEKILAEDKRWRDDFLRRFAEIDVSRLRLDFLDGVSATVRSYSRRGYVDFRSAYRCERELRSYVQSFLDPLGRAR